MTGLNFILCGRPASSAGVIALSWILISPTFAQADTDGDAELTREPGRAEAGKSHRAPLDPLHRLERLNGGSIGELFKEAVGSSERFVIPLFSPEPDGKLVVLATAIAKDGYALTKASELEPYLESGGLVARLKDDVEAKVKIVELRSDNDLALVKVDATLEPIQWASPSPEEIKPGFWVAAFSHPGHQVKVGIVSAALRPIDREGGFVGVKIHAREGRGALILHVFENSGADKAGLKSGDVVHFVAGKPVNSTSDFKDVMTKFDANETVEIVVERQVEGHPKKWAVEVELGYRQEVLDEVDRNQAVNGDSSKRRGGFQNVIQHDIPLRPDAMGGPLFTVDGSAVGLNIARQDRVTTFALPAALVNRLSAEMIVAARVGDSLPENEEK